MDHFNNPFQYDDSFAIVTNPYIRDIKNIPLFFKDASTSCSYAPNQVYRPINTTLNAIDCWMGGKGEPVPFYYHLSMFISFILLGVFIYLLALKIYDKAFAHHLNPYIALLTAGVFLLHTANAETINYIYERSDLVSSLMVVIALCVLVYSQNSRKYSLYLLPMFIGLLVKEPAVMVAPLAFLYLFLFEENKGLNELFSASGFRVFRKTIPAFLLAVVMFLFGQRMTSWWSAGGYMHEHASFKQDVLPYLFTQFFVIVHYVNNFIFPVNLSADSQDWPLMTNPFDEKVVFGFAFICFTLYLAYKASLQAKSRPITFGILWFYLALAPNSSIVPFPEVIRDLRTFFAFIGLTIAVVWALFLLYTKYEAAVSKNLVLRSFLLLGIGLFFVAQVYGVRQRTEVWSSEEKLWYDVTQKAPLNGRALMYYGKNLMAKGDYNGALDYLTRAKQIWPNYTYININLGVLYNAMKNYPESEASFKHALQLDPVNPDCFSYYAYALMGNGRNAEAKTLIEQGLKYAPANAMLNNLNKQLGNAAAAPVASKATEFENLVKQSPTPENYISLSVEYYNEARYYDCIAAAEQALKLRPDYDLGYNNICTAYNALHKWDKAIEAGKKAVALNSTSELIRNNLRIAEDGKRNSR